MNTDPATLALDIVADPVCPWCYVGAKSLLAARDRLAEEIPLAIRWRPYQLDPSTPADGVDRHAYTAPNSRTLKALPPRAR